MSLTPLSFFLDQPPSGGGQVAPSRRDEANPLYRNALRESLARAASPRETKPIPRKQAVRPAGGGTVPTLSKSAARGHRPTADRPERMSDTAAAAKAGPTTGSSQPSDVSRSPAAPLDADRPVIDEDTGVDDRHDAPHFDGDESPPWHWQTKLDFRQDPPIGHGQSAGTEDVAAPSDETESESARTADPTHPPLPLAAPQAFDVRQSIHGRGNESGDAMHDRAAADALRTSAESPGPLEGDSVGNATFAAAFGEESTSGAGPDPGFDSAAAAQPGPTQQAAETVDNAGSDETAAATPQNRRQVGPVDQANDDAKPVAGEELAPTGLEQPETPAPSRRGAANSRDEGRSEGEPVPDEHDSGRPPSSIAPQSGVSPDREARPASGSADSSQHEFESEGSRFVEAAADAAGTAADVAPTKSAGTNSPAARGALLASEDSPGAPPGNGSNSAVGHAEARTGALARGDASNGDNASGRAQPRVDSGEFVDRLTAALHASRDGGRQMRIRLNPPELGSLQIEVIARNGTLSARLEVETSAARQAVLEHLGQLRETLAQQGTPIERIDVHLDSRHSEGRASDFARGGGEQPQADQRERSGNRPAAARPETEIVETPAARRAAARLDRLDIRI